MQERDGLRALKREIRMAREGKVKRKICVWKRKEKKEKKKKRENEREKEKREKKRKEEEWQERYEVDESSERYIKCKKGCHVVETQNFHSFSNHVQSDNEDVIGAS
jgi:hypothetical protein